MAEPQGFGSRSGKEAASIYIEAFCRLLRSSTSQLVLEIVCWKQ